MKIHAYPNKWTPKLAHKFAMKRVEKIRFMLEEIAGCYEDVDQSILNECDQIHRYSLGDLEEALDNVLEEGKTP